MLRAEKYMEAQTSVLSVAAEIVRVLIVKQHLPLTNIQTEIELAFSNRNVDITPALLFLYATGKIEYYLDSDVVSLKVGS